MRTTAPRHHEQAGLGRHHYPLPVSTPRFPLGVPLGPSPGPVPAGPPPTPGPAAHAPRRRITGIDVARSLAILGMLVAHLGTGHSADPAGPGWGSEWMWIFDGRSSALFATLAGCSIALMSRSVRAAGTDLGWRALRVKIAVRAGILLVIGIVLQVLDTPIAIILPSYAVLFVMSLPVLRLPTRWLLALTALSITLGPVVVFWLRWQTSGWIGPTQAGFGWGVGELVWGYYPALVWIGYLLLGLVVGRGPLGSVRYAVALLVAGVALAALGYGVAAAMERTSLLLHEGWAPLLLGSWPHSDTTLEVLGNMGVALAVTGACLLVTTPRLGRLLLWPLASAGAMSLTIYTAQIVVIAVLGSQAVYYPTSNLPLVIIALASVGFACLWRPLLGQGPLERLLKVASDGAAATLRPPAGRRRW